MPGTQTTVEVFCSYAHEDEEGRDKLEKHLSPLKREGLISFWYDRKILPGTDWSTAIDQHLESASLILLLISPDFIASKYCYEIEMERALERHEAEEARVVPILLRYCNWHSLPCARLQALPAGKFLDEWDEREEDKALAGVVAGIRDVIAQLSPSTSSPNHAPGRQAAWNMPFARNSFFSEREQELADLHAQLRQHSAAAIGQVRAISGLGGIGKTQLAIEYAYRHREDYQFILWVHAGSLETLNASYSELARLLNLREKDAREQEIVVQAVRRWLEMHTGWLLILDNLDEPSVLFPSNEAGQPRQPSPFLPLAPGGHVLISTRRADLTNLGMGMAHPLDIKVFTSEQGASFLLQRAKLLVNATAEEREQARQITQELGGLPLALDQAGAYLAATGESLSGYLRLFQQSSANLLKQHRGREYPESVATTWDISFRRVEERDPAAAELLRFCAFLAPEAIPEEILTEGAVELGPILSSVAADAFRLNAAIENLRAYSLITRDPRARTLTVHRLVQAVLRASLPARKRKQWMQRAVLAVTAAFPSVEFANWLTCERLLPHALFCASWTEQASLETLEASRLLSKVGNYLSDRARYTEAEPLYQRALVLCERLLGPEHPATAMSLNNLALLYKIQGKYDQVEPLYQRALAIWERQLGPEHLDTVTGLSNLAALYHAQGKYKQVEYLFLKVLKIRKQRLGLNHPDTATSLNNLAQLYDDQGKYDQAEPLFRQALEIREQRLGLDHPDTAMSLNNLAELYRTRGKYDQAEPLFQRALEIHERQLGPAHPDTALGLNNLAFLYDTQGKYDQAEPLYQRALAICERALGADHPTTQLVRKNYAIMRQEMEQAARARQDEE